MKNHHNYPTVSLGTSDIASLTIRSASKVSTLDFGSDGGYKAYVVDADCEIPEHYHLVSSYSFGSGMRTWIAIYDDEHRVLQAFAEEIKIFRAGEMGCIIQLINDGKYTACNAYGQTPMSLDEYKTV